MASDHILKRFDEELERLNATINEMGGLTESQFAKALTAVRDRDTATAEEVIADDARVDALDTTVQDQTVKLLALRQPMAVDLRVVLSSIKIAAALERIADYAKNTAKRSIILAQASPPPSAVAGIDRLGRLVRTALKDVPRKRRRERRSSPGLRGQSANDGFMVNLDGAMGAGVVAASLVGPNPTLVSPRAN